jgi:hypothetical protein
MLLFILVCLPRLNEIAAATGDPWQRIDAGPFSFQAPADMTRTSLRGIDSYVAGYENERCRLSFDYGVYSDPLRSYGDKPEFEEQMTEIDGRPARIITYVEPAPFYGFPFEMFSRTGPVDVPYRAAVNFADLGPGIGPPGPARRTGLTMAVGCVTRADRDAAMAILSSIIFPAE